MSIMGSIWNFTVWNKHKLFIAWNLAKAEYLLNEQHWTYAPQEAEQMYFTAMSENHPVTIGSIYDLRYDYSK